MTVRSVVCCLAVAVCLAPPLARSQPAETGGAHSARAMVATVHPLATEAGLRAFQRGGNAVDAAVAAALMLGVVDGHNSGIGGGCFILVRRADGRLVGIDGRETAPAAAHRDMYVRQGRPQPEWSKTGPLAVGTPGALAAYDLALREHGRLELAAMLEQAADVAQRGFPIDRPYAADIKATAHLLARFPGSRSVLLKEDGAPYLEGEVLRQADLARTYRGVARDGLDYFYRGPFADAVDRWMADHGGILTRQDLADYRPRQRTPLVTRYRHFTIVGFPPPSSGGVHVAQILNILERFDLADLYQNDRAAFVHVVAEAMKLAFADRAHWLGDADFARVPRGLIDKSYAATLAARIDLRQTIEVAGHGLPPAAMTDLFGKHTTHIAAADVEGNWVAITATVNTTFGSKVIVPGTGVVLNNEMDDFSIRPGVPNAFGLIGAEANAVQPGKRPLSSMSPTIVLNDGQPVLTLGAAGGPTIINQVVLGIVRRLDLQLALPQAVAAPRFHHQWVPDRLRIEAGLDADVLQRLEELGHELQAVDRIGVTQAIDREPSRGHLRGVHDPRVPGKAAGR